MLNLIIQNLHHLRCLITLYMAVCQDDARSSRQLQILSFSDAIVVIAFTSFHCHCEDIWNTPRSNA